MSVRHLKYTLSGVAGQATDAELTGDIELAVCAVTNQFGAPNLTVVRAHV